MKRDLKNIVIGFVLACLIVTPVVAFADTLQVALNTVNINLNGTQAAAKGQSYTLANGSIVPYSLNYNGTVYLPIRKMSELVGKDISYDGSSSTINISDKKAENGGPAPTDPPEDAVKPDPEKEQGAAEKSDTAEKSGFAVINSFYKVRDKNGVQVNQLEGFLDARSCDMLTSQADLIQHQETVPALYEITYSNNVITKMKLISSGAEDTAKGSPEGGSLEGSKNTYSLASDAVCYRMKIDQDGSFDRYSLSDVESIQAGDKVYLYNTDGVSGYDVVLIKK